MCEEFSENDVLTLQGLGELLDDLITMETLVYECGVGEWLSIRELREMSEYTRIELMMEKVFISG